MEAQHHIEQRETLRSVKGRIGVKRVLATFSILVLTLASAAPMRGEQNPFEVYAGFPGFITMQSTYPPMLSSVMGKPQIYYEVYVLNTYGADILLQTLKVSSGTEEVKSFDAAALASMVRPIGIPDAKPSATIPAATTSVIYIALDFPDVQRVPAVLKDTLTFRLPKANNQSFTVRQALLHVHRQPPVVIQPPLHGDGWYAGSGPSNASDHRRTIFYKAGRPLIGQRFAIDWVQAKREGNRWSAVHGDLSKNSNWYGENAPLYAVADGRIVSLKTDIPENVPNQKPVVKITQETIGGNYVVIDIGYGRYAFYAHMIPHSATVKLGDRVRAGEVIGRLGNSGNSSAPHLHFHITNAPAFIFAEGEPYAFGSFHALRAVSSAVISSTEAAFKTTGGLTAYKNTMPGDEAVVDFSSP